jgi:hypothetical protein
VRQAKIIKISRSRRSNRRRSACRRTQYTDKPTVLMWGLQGNRQLRRPNGRTQKSYADRYLDIGCDEYDVYRRALTLPKGCPKTATSRARL